MGKWIKKTASEWSVVFEAQAGSGITASRFCRDQGINYKQFLYFRKKMRRICGTQSLVAATAAISSPVPRRGGFIPVTINSGPAMRLKFPRGLIVESDGLLPVAWITEAASLWLQMGEE